MTKRGFILRSYRWHSLSYVASSLTQGSGFASTLGYKSPPPEAGASYPDLWPALSRILQGIRGSGCCRLAAAFIKESLRKRP